MELNDNDKQRIGKAADEFGFRVPFDGTKNFYEHGMVEGFQAGAEYATIYERKEQTEEITNLKAWKESEMKLWGPVIDYAQTHRSELGLRLGESISEKILQFLKDKITEI